MRATGDRYDGVRARVYLSWRLSHRVHVHGPANRDDGTTLSLLFLSRSCCDSVMRKTSEIADVIVASTRGFTIRVFS